MASLLLRCQECRQGFEESAPMSWPVWCVSCNARILAAIVPTLDTALVQVEVTPCGDRFGIRYKGEVVGLMHPIPNRGDPAAHPVPDAFPVLWSVFMGGGHDAVTTSVGSAVSYASALAVWRAENPNPNGGAR